MTKKAIFAALAAGLMLATAAGAGEDGIGRPELPISGPRELVSLVAEAAANNGELGALAARVEALREEAPAAGALDDPRIGLRVSNLPADTFRFDQEPMTQKQISVSQKLPWFGKRSLRTRSALLDARREEAVLEARRLELAAEVAEAYYDLARVAVDLEVNEKLREMIGQVLTVAEARYASGSGVQQDVLQAQVEVSRLLEERLVLDKKHRVLEARMGRLLNRPFSRSAPPPPIRDLPALDRDVERLAEEALIRHPGVAARNLRIERADAQVELARRDYLPDPDFSISYGQRDEDAAGRDRADFFSAGVTFPLPLWHKDKQDRRLGAARKLREAAQIDYRGFAAELPRRIEGLVAEIRGMQENLDLLRGPLAVQADSWARAADSAYRVGRADFDALIASKVRVLRIERQTADLVYGILSRRARLETLVGLPLEDPAQWTPDAPRGGRAAEPTSGKGMKR